MTFLKGIIDAVKLQDANQLVTIVGAGGKTSALFTLAKELKKRGEKVLVTTTTAIYKPREQDYDRLFLGDKTGFQKEYRGVNSQLNSGEIILWAKNLDSAGKLRGLDPKEIDEVWNTHGFTWILVEGDGAKRMNIKAPKEDEPVIPSKTTLLIGVIGMSVLGKSVDESRVHRLKYFTALTGTEVGDPIDENVLRRLVLEEQGLFKGKPIHCSSLLLLNQCENQQIRDRAFAFGESLPVPFLITSLRHQKLYTPRRAADQEG